ncbi:hypothetical protein AXG93_4698s1330 [Marchantia polymorpha subsp. ruderalis]|uniref:Uncharacterized protein n=1 Tax=Marchantia polymorpha subsp. ruderalis TaxID=1480154 RepID=A0A176VJE3_MARPO|nr:hypothetical protein AXG93_4698s1330 [Marchantia polymorpha subsp. ruderalis]
MIVIMMAKQIRSSLATFSHPGTAVVAVRVNLIIERKEGSNSQVVRQVAVKVHPAKDRRDKQKEEVNYGMSNLSSVHGNRRTASLGGANEVVAAAQSISISSRQAGTGAASARLPSTNSILQTCQKLRTPNVGQKPVVMAPIGYGCSGILTV